MEPNQTMRRPVSISRFESKLRKQIPDLRHARHDRLGIRQSIGNVLAGARQSCMTTLLTALLVAGLWVAPSIAQECACTPCHGTLEEVHGNFDHTSTPGSGPVILFNDYTHDSANWTSPSPQFDVVVSCTTCHYTDLRPVHGNDCATCHPTPYDTLGIWGGGCQQGGCHSFYHTASTKGHMPFENVSDPANDCSRCHQPGGEVTSSKCLNCHDEVVAEDLSPPTSTSNVQSTYDGPAKIDFLITDNGKVGVGRIFYKLDGGGTKAAGKSLVVEQTGSHSLEFWAMDQYGNQELATNTVLFSIVADDTPPVTTSNAQPTYYQGAVITLTATDESTKGVKATYYSLNGGATQVGTTVVIPATPGTVTYTLIFWSEDWSGNVEAQNTVNFTVISGTGTIRLIWGASDTAGSPCPGDPEANAAWTIRRDSWTGPVVSTGYAGCPNWSGVNDVTVPAGSTLYFVTVDWWDSYYGYDEQSAFANITVTTAGDTVKPNY
jgi:hypothetical protein